MKGENTTKDQLINELEELRQRIAEFEHSEAERKRSEKALRENEEKCRTLVEDMPALVCRFLLDGSLTFVNSLYCEYFNKNSEDLIGANFFQFIPEEDRERVRDHFQSLTHDRPMVTYEHQVITPKGEIRWQRRTDRALFDGQGNLSEYQSVGFDITEHRRAEETIKRRLEFEKTVSTISSRFINVSNIDDAINTSLGDMGRACGVSRTYLFLVHQDGAFMDNTHEWCAEGVSPQIDNLQNLSIIAFPWLMAKLQEEETLHIKDVSIMPIEAKAEKEIFEMQDIKSLLLLPVHVKGEVNGYIGLDNVIENEEWSDDNITLLSVSAGIIGQALDRKWREKLLEENEEFCSSLLSNSPHPILVINPDTSLRYVNSAMEMLTGFSAAEIIGRKAPYPWWIDETMGQTSTDLKQAMRNGAKRLEELFQKKSGERFRVEIIGSFSN